MKNKFRKKQIMILGAALISILLLAGCTDNSTSNSDENNQETGDNNNAGNSDNSGNSNGYAVNVDPNMVGNWTWTSGTNSGEPITHISSGWVNFKEDGTFNSYYDYGYTVVVYEGTWQAKDGDLYWGTNGHEISDWYSYDTYDFITNNGLTIISDSSEMLYQRR